MPFFTGFKKFQHCLLGKPHFLFTRQDFKSESSHSKWQSLLFPRPGNIFSLEVKPFFLFWPAWQGVHEKSLFKEEENPTEIRI